MTNKQVSREEVITFFRSCTKQLLTIALASNYEDPKEAFSNIMTNKLAAGYVFGFHDAFVRRFGLLDIDSPDAGLKLMESSYQNIFGEQAGFALFSMSLSFQENPDFRSGQINGGNELIAFMESKTPPLGLGRILILGLKE